MAVWAIGDLQGCYDTTQRLLERIRFDPARDELWFCGDLVNRGGQSLETLRLVHSLRKNAKVVLGNHDLSLIAIGERTVDEKRRVNPDLQRVVFAEDAPELLTWLRQRPLAHHDAELGWLMVHAGIAPNWSLEDTLTYAGEVEARLRGGSYRKLLRAMYGNRPMFNAKLRGFDRYRAIINVFTRMRYCTPRGRIAFEEKGVPGSQPIGLYPWFSVPGQAVRDVRIVSGHWSALGLSISGNVHAIDTGAVWGGKLTALRLDGDEFELRQVQGRMLDPSQAAAIEE